MSTLLIGYLLLMSATHAGGVLVAARRRSVLSAGVNAVLLTVALMLLLEVWG